MANCVEYLAAELSTVDFLKLFLLLFELFFILVSIPEFFFVYFQKPLVQDSRLIACVLMNSFERVSEEP